MLGACSSRLVKCLINLLGLSHLGSWVFPWVEQSQVDCGSQEIWLEAVTLLADVNSPGCPKEVVCDWQPDHA